MTQQAPTVAEIEQEAIDLSELATDLGFAADERKFNAFLASLVKFNAAVSPKDELLWRLNEWVSDRDPGKPMNWKGL